MSATTTWAALQLLPDFLLRIDRSGRIAEVKPGEAKIPLLLPEVEGTRLQDLLVPEIGRLLERTISHVLEQRTVASFDYALTKDGKEYACEARVLPLGDEELVVMIRPIAGLVESEAMRVGQRRALELIATGAPLHDTLMHLVKLAEAQSTGMLCSLLLMDSDGQRLRAGPAPSFPKEFSEAVDGLCIGEGVGSCGTAAARREIVIVADIKNDPLWAKYLSFAERFQVSACWSAPIFSQRGTVLGTFAMYYREPRSPNPSELRLIELASHLAGIAIERKRAEEELFSSQQMLRSVLDTIPQRVFWKDCNSVYVGCNRPLALDCGYSNPEEIAGKTDYNTDAAEVADLYRADDRRVMESGRARLNYEEPQLKSDGSLRWLRTSKVPLHDKDGRVIGVLGTYEDITERKATEEALRQAERKYRSIFENAVEGMFQSTLEGRFITVNPSLARMLGYGSPEEVIEAARDPAYQLFAEPSERADYLRLLEKDGMVRRFECELLRKDGTRLWASFGARAVRGLEGEAACYEGTVEDVTERRRLEEQFRQSQKMEAFGQLAGGVAHDFNNLLTVMMGSISMLRLGGLKEAQTRAAIDECFRAAQQAANLTGQLLMFSRRQPFAPRELNLNEVVGQATKLLQRLIGEHITLEASYTPGVAPIRGDPGMIEQALMNLTVNSRDAMPRGGRLLLQTNQVELRPDEARVRPGAKAGIFLRLSVSDTGAGILPEHRPHLFEPFFTTKAAGKGTGLGLATVFGIVEQHGGWIEVESSPGQGTTFHLFFPRHGRDVPSVERVRPTSAPRGGSETILIVEDEPAVRSLMRTLLERHGYRVHEAISGAAALQTWPSHRDEIDLLVTDMVMPGGVSGRDLSDRLRADKPGLKVIHCSGYTDEMLGSDNRLRDNPHFLEKPFDLHVFLKRVRECLDGR